MTIDNSHQHLEAFDAHELLIFAARYCTGRKTIAAASFAEQLAEAWPTIPAHTRRVIQRDLEREFEDDDMARAEGSAYRPLGMDCDRQAWELVRQTWMKEETS